MAQAPEAPDTSLIEAGRTALARHEWRAAFDALSKADGQGRLNPEALELLAQAACWTGQLPVTIDARERAFAAATKVGDMEGAAIAAINLARDNLLRMATDVSQAWIKRVESMLEGVEENEGHGWLAIVIGLRAALVGDSEAHLAQAKRATEIGGACGAMSNPAGWLLCQNINYNGLVISESAGFESAGLTVSIDPASGVTMPPRGRWVEVVAHLDDPAARDCAPAGGGDQDPVSVVLTCRSELVADSVKSVAGPY